MSGRKVHGIILCVAVGIGCALFCTPCVEAQTPSDVMNQCPRRTGGMNSHVRVVYYDARQERFFYDNGDPVTGDVEIGEHVVLEVCHARFGEQFDFTLTEKTLPEAGAPVRGLDDVAGLIKGLPGSPAAKGVGMLESVRFTTYPDVDTLVAKLRSLQDIVGLKTELEQDLESIQYGNHLLEEDYKKYRRAICQMTTQIPAADCASLGVPPAGMPPRIEAVEAKMQSLGGEAGQAASAVLTPRTSTALCPSSPNIPAGAARYRDRSQFVCFVNYTNQIIGQFRNLRALIAQPPLASAAPDLISQLEEYKLRIFTYKKKLEQVKAAVEIERILLKSDPNVLLSRLKKIQDTYKDVVTPDDIQQIADEQRGFIVAQERKDMTEQLNILAACCGGPQTQETKLAQLNGETTTRIEEVRQLDLSFAARVYQANQTLVHHIRELYRLYEQSETDPIFVQMFTWSGNTGVILGVKAADSFKPVDLNKLELPMETSGVEASTPASLAPAVSAAPASAAVAQVQSSTPASAPPAASAAGTPSPSGTGGTGQTPAGNASTVTTSEFPATAGTTTAWEVHKTYRFNVAAGALFSSVRQNYFALRSVPGSPTSNLYLVQTGRDRMRFDFPIFLTTYLGKPLDVYTSISANRPKFGTAVGFSTLDVTNNAYVGGFFQPHLGLDFILGLHLAKRNVPDRGIIPGVTILDPNTTTAPIHGEWKPGVFLTVGFDALTFKKLFFGAN
jgi:hypothetical protein